MNRSWIACLALILAAPAFAQDEAEVVPAEPEAEAPAEAPAEAAPAEEAPAEEAAPAEQAAAEEPAEPWALYFGADYVNTTLSVSAPVGAPASEFDSTMVRLRAGKRILDAVGLELHYGIDEADEKSGEVTTDSYYGVYLVPTATVFEMLELAFPVGYGRSEFGDSGEALGGIAYGIDAELPLRALGDLPDLRLTAGWMVYYQDSDARVYGANFGLRYDFTTASLGNPFGFLSGLWPFGGDDEKAPSE
jgi:hypothetical protein